MGEGKARKADEYDGRREGTDGEKRTSEGEFIQKKQNGMQQEVPMNKRNHSRSTQREMGAGKKQNTRREVSENKGRRRGGYATGDEYREGEEHATRDRCRQRETEGEGT